MPEFTNVTVIKMANVYFDGKVVSLTVVFADGSKKTLGIMQPGEFECRTGGKEVMESSAVSWMSLSPAPAVRGR